MAESEHSKFSASSWDRWGACPGSFVMSRGIPPRPPGRAASEGTVKHQVLAWTLTEKRPAAAYIGRMVPADGKEFEVTKDFAADVQVAADMIVAETADAELVISETRVNYSKWLQVPTTDAWGTADVVAVRGDTLIVPDYKSGYRPVSKDSGQFKLYALGALGQYGDLADIRSVRLGAIQPAVATEFDPLVLSVDELVKWGLSTARSAAQSVLTAESTAHQADELEWQDTFLNPGDKQCSYCPAFATCPAARREVEVVTRGTSANVDEFPAVDDVKALVDTFDTTKLAKAGRAVPFLEAFIKAVQGEIEGRVLGGEKVPGFKVVQGKRGNRKWADEAAAEAALKAIRLKVEEMYDLTVISPTSAEKLAKAKVIGPRQWPKLQQLIVQADGKPHVTTDEDPRQAISLTPAIEEFPVLPDAADFSNIV